MGEDGSSDAWHQIQLGLDVVETCARELDPRLRGRVVALRQQVITPCSLRRESAGGESPSGGLDELVREVQDVVRHLREIVAVEGAALTAPANELTRGPDALAAEVEGRSALLVEIEEKFFRVSDCMWDVLRSVEATHS